MSDFLAQLIHALNFYTVGLETLLRSVKTIGDTIFGNGGKIVIREE